MQMLVQSSAGTGFLHESFDKDNVKVYTRSWFAWVNGAYVHFSVPPCACGRRGNTLFGTAVRFAVDDGEKALGRPALASVSHSP
jgi:hypothetical protein